MTFPYDSSKKYIKPGSKSSYFVDKKGDQSKDKDKDNVNDNVNRKYVKFNTEEVGSKRQRYWDACVTCDTCGSKDKDKDKDESSDTPKKVPRGSEDDDFANGGDFIAF